MRIKPPDAFVVVQLQDSINKARLVLTFYRSFVLASSTVTAVCGWLVWTSGLAAFGVAVWIKVLSGAAIVYLVNRLKQRAYYYYFNLGFSKTALWISTLTLDFFIFIGAAAAANLLR